MDYETGYKDGWEDSRLEIVDAPRVVVWIDRKTGGFRWARYGVDGSHYEDLMDGLEDATDCLDEDYNDDDV